MTKPTAQRLAQKIKFDCPEVVVSDHNTTEGETMQFRAKHRGQFLKVEGLSRRADQARANGTLPLAQVAKLAGLTQAAIKRHYINYRTEWHHELTSGGRVKEIYYLTPLDDDEIEEIKESEAEYKERQRRQRATIVGQGWTPLLTLPAGDTLYVKDHEYRAAPVGSTDPATLRPAIDTEIAEHAAMKSRMQRLQRLLIESEGKDRQ